MYFGEQNSKSQKEQNGIPDTDNLKEFSKESIKDVDSSRRNWSILGLANKWLGRARREAKYLKFITHEPKGHEGEEVVMETKSVGDDSWKELWLSVEKHSYLYHFPSALWSLVSLKLN